MWVKRVFLITMSVGAAVPLWLLGNSAASIQSTISPSRLQNGNYTQSLAAMQSTIVQWQAVASRPQIHTVTSASGVVY